MELPAALLGCVAGLYDGSDVRRVTWILVPRAGGRFDLQRCADKLGPLDHPH